MKEISKFHFTLPILAVFGLIYTFVFNNEPPTLPIPLDKEVVDCFNINVNNISNVNNNIYITIHADKLHEYPQLAAPYLLRIKTKVGDFESQFSHPALYNITTDNGTSSFYINQKSSGNMTVSVTCQNILLSEKTIKIEEINSYITGYTYFTKKDNISHSVNNICIRGSQLSMFSEAGGNIPSYKASSTINGTVLLKNEKISEKIGSDTFTLASAYIIQSNPNNANDIMIDAILPTFVNQQTKGLLPIYLMEENDALRKGMSYISGHQSIIANESRCLGEAIFIPARGNKDIHSLRVQTEEEQINSIFNSSTDFGKLKKLFNCKERITKTIVDAEYNEVFAKKAKGCNYISIKGITDIDEIAKIVSTADVFIANEKDSYIQSVWLSKGSKLITNTSSNIENILREKLSIDVSKDFSYDYCF